MAVAHFEYSTGDACGQNMVTSVTSHLCKWILSKIADDLPAVHVVNYCIVSGLCGDKSITFRNLWRTRGCHVQAEAWIPENVLKSVLKVRRNFNSYPRCDNSMIAYSIGGCSHHCSLLSRVATSPHRSWESGVWF